MVVFGGYFEVTKELNDLFLFDFVQQKWIQIFREVNSPVSPHKLIAGTSSGNNIKGIKANETNSSRNGLPYQDSNITEGGAMDTVGSLPGQSINDSKLTIGTGEVRTAR